MIAFTSAIEPLRIANRLSGRPLYDWRLVSRDGGAGAGEQRHRDPGRCRHRGATSRPATGTAAGRRPVRRAGLGALPEQGGVRLAAPLGPARRPDRRLVHRRARAGPRRPARPPSLHDPLGEPAGLHRGVPGDPGHLGPLRDRPQPLHLLGRHGGARPDAAPDRAGAWRRARDQGLRAVHRRPHPRPARPPAHAAAGAAGRAPPQADPARSRSWRATSRSR